MSTAVVTGWSVHLPGAQRHDSLPDIGAACPPEQASTLLGRKGLLMKEAATRLGLCAVQRALGTRAGTPPGPRIMTDTAVVASSNLGNVETVVEVTRTVATAGHKAVSPMAAPNASSNVLAGTVAMWFRLGGPNLMVCSGRASGSDAIRLAMLLLRAGRASRVVVVGAEPADPVATRLHSRGGPGAPLRAGAACVILERHGAGPRLQPLPDGTSPVPGLRIGASGLDPVAAWGDCYGAQGVLDVALAAQLAADRAEPVACGHGPARRVVLVP